MISKVLSPENSTHYAFKNLLKNFVLSNLHIVREKFGQLLPTFSFKLIGSALTFLSLQQLVAKIGLDLFGIYSQITSVYFLFSSIASLGFANSFIRSNVNKSRNEVLRNYQQIKSIVFTLSILLSPIMFFLVYRLVGNNTFSVICILLVFILFSDFRIRFSFLRISGNEGSSEVPMVLVKPAVIIISLNIIQPLNLSNIFLILLLSELACYYCQYLLSKDLSIPKTFQNIKLFSINLSSLDFGYGVWIFNSLNNLKVFIDLTVISILFTNEGSAEYKILTMFAVLLMSVYNASNITSSHKYASWMIDKKFNKVNTLMYKNLLRCILIYCPFALILIIACYNFELLSYFNLGSDSILGLVFVCMPSFFALLLGPSPQLAVHLKETNILNKVKLIRIILSALPLCQIYFWASSQTSFLVYVLYLAILEILLHLSMSFFLYKKYKCIPPVFFKLIP